MKDETPLGRLPERPACISRTTAREIAVTNVSLRSPRSRQRATSFRLLEQEKWADLETFGDPLDVVELRGDNYDGRLSGNYDGR